MGYIFSLLDKYKMDTETNALCIHTIYSFTFIAKSKKNIKTNPITLHVSTIKL